MIQRSIFYIAAPSFVILFLILLVPNLVTQAAYARTPHNAGFERQWNLHNIGQYGGLPGADISAESTWNLRTNCSSGVVAVIDNGFNYTLPEFQGNWWVNPGWNFAENNSNIFPNYNLRNPSYDHGTSVAGIIAAKDNAFFGSPDLVGVCWNAKIMGLKVQSYQNSISGGVLNNTAILKALDYVSLMKQSGVPIKVVNLSLGNNANATLNNPMFLKLQTLQSEGILVVAAADEGKSGAQQNSDIANDYPTKFSQILDNVIGVGASNQTDDYVSWSNFGKHTINLAAPGDSIPLVISGYLFTWNKIFNDTGILHTTSLLFMNKLSSTLGEMDLQTGFGNPPTFVKPFNLTLNAKSITKSSDNSTITITLKNNDTVTFSLINNQTRVSSTYFNATSGTPFFIPIFFNAGLDKGLLNVFLRPSGQEYYNTFGDGTSFATPQVAATAALLFAQHPNATYQEVKAAILNGTDKIIAYENKTTSSGRLDAFGAISLGTVFGRAYIDKNNNGVFDQGDIPLAGKKVSIDSIVPFYDNINPIPTLIHFPIATTNTTANGTYSITPPKGLFSVSIEPVEGLASPNPVVRVAFPSVYSSSFPVDFAYQEPAQNLTVNGVVFLDKNENGVRDPGELGVPNAVVTISNFSFSNGVCIFGGGLSGVTLADGTFSINATSLPGNCGTVTANDLSVSDQSGTYTLTRTLTPFVIGSGPLDIPVKNFVGGVHGLVLKGIMKNSNPFSNPSFTFNSSQPPWTQRPLAGVQVALHYFGDLNDSSDDKIFNTTTAADGSYSFANVPFGVAEVYVGTPPAGLRQQYPPAGAYITDTCCLSTVSLDFGYADPPGIVSGYVFNDANSNGVFDAADFGIPNYHVVLSVTSLLDNSSLVDIKNIPTDENGFFRFDDVVPGKVVLDGSQAPFFYSFSTQTVPLSGKYSFTLSPGTAVTKKNFGFHGTIFDPLGANTILFIDPPRGPLPPFLINITKFNDIDMDGVKEANEKGLQGFTFSINDGNDKSVANVTTHDNGNANYTILDPVQNPPPYTVTEIQKPGYVSTTSNIEIKFPDFLGGNVAIGKNVTALAINYEFGNHAVSSVTCAPPIGGDWTISSSCTLTNTVSVPANLIINSGVVLTVPSGMSLNVDLVHNHILVRAGGGLLIQAGGKIN